MKIICALYYYYPYISGLSIYCRKLAEHMLARGHEVTIVTSRYDRDLDAEEVVKGVRVIRVPVWFRLDKGVIMGSFLPTIIRLGLRSDVVNLHMAMVEAWPIARLLPKKTVLTYHCQIRLNNRTLLGRLMERGIKSSFRRAIAQAATTVSSSFDYAANNSDLSGSLEKVTIIPPPIDPVSSDEAAQMQADYFRYRADIPPGSKVIGFLGRIVYEKGIDFLIHAFTDLQKKHDDLYLIIAGDYTDVAGGSVKHMLMRYLSAQDNRIRFTGRLNDAEVDAFYRFIDVRTVVQRTGMGKVVPRRDPHALAIAIEQVIYQQDYTTRSAEEVFRFLDLSSTVQMYEELFKAVGEVSRSGAKPLTAPPAGPARAPDRDRAIEPSPASSIGLTENQAHEENALDILEELAQYKLPCGNWSGQTLEEMKEADINTSIKGLTVHVADLQKIVLPKDTSGADKKKFSEDYQSKKKMLDNMQEYIKLLKEVN